MAIHVDAGDGALSHADGGTAVAGDHAAQELEEVGVMAHYQHAFAVRIFDQHLLEGGEDEIRKQLMQSLDAFFEFYPEI